jgi:hydrogenase-4 component F
MLLFLAIIFVGMAVLILEMALGEPESRTPRAPESWWLLVGPLGLAAAVLMLGVFIPGPLQHALAIAATALGGTAP